MITPAIGLAVIVHVCIIAWHKFFRWVPKGKKVEEKYATGAMHSVGFAVVVLVSVGIFALAFSIIHASITEKHSSIYFIGGVISNTYAALSHAESQSIANQDPDIEAVIGVITAPHPEAVTTTDMTQAREATVATDTITDTATDATNNSSLPTDEYTIMAQSLELAKNALFRMQEELTTPTSATP